MTRASASKALVFTVALLLLSLHTAFAQVRTTLTLSHQNNPSNCYVLLATSLNPGQQISTTWSGYGGCTLALYNRNTGAALRDRDGQVLSVSRDATRRTGNTVALNIPDNIAPGHLNSVVLLVKNHSWDYDIAATVSTPASVATVNPPVATPLAPTFTRHPVTGVVTARLIMSNLSDLGIDTVSYIVSDRSGLLTYGISTIGSGQGLRFRPNQTQTRDVVLPRNCAGITVTVTSEAYSGSQSITRNYIVR